MEKKQTVRPFGLRDKLGYLFGDLANDFTFIFAGSYLMKFYTDVLGVSAVLVGVLFVAARCVDAFTDVGMGRLIDTMPPAKEGRFRPWLKRMALPLAIMNVLMYLYAARDLPYGLKVAYMFITYILWGSVCYTAANIPYGSMASVISPNAADRTSLSTFRSLGAMLAGIPVMVVTPLVVFRTTPGGGQEVLPARFTLMAVIYSVLAVISYYLCYALCTERVQLPAKQRQEGAGFGALVRGLARNRALLALIGSALAMLLAQLLSQTMNLYLFADYFGNATLVAIVSLSTMAPTLALAPFATKISQRFGKKEASLVGVGVATVAYGLLFVLQTTSPWVYIIAMLVGGVGLGFFNMVLWAFITDVIDYQEVLTGSRDDGTVYAVYSFSRKLGQALAGGVGGFALAAIGYISSTEYVQQSERTLRGIYNISTLTPAVCYLIVLLLLWLVYPLNKREVEKNTALLEEKRKGHG